MTTTRLSRGDRSVRRHLLAPLLVTGVLAGVWVAAPLPAQRPAPVAAVRVFDATDSVSRPTDDGRISSHDARVRELDLPARLVAQGATGPYGRIARKRRDPAPWWSVVASALAPGAGQAALDQDRWVGYAALEGVAWLRYLADRQEARREQRGYRRVANKVARALYSTGTPVAGSFEYYETMEKWAASGVYDAQPGGALDPEPDSTTFNGAMWLLARQTFWADPNDPPFPETNAYQNAIAFYQRRAIRPEFRWSWRDAQLQQDLYRRTILRSNAAYRRATQDLAAVLANHVLSTVDAYVSVRLRRHPGPLGGETSIEATIPWP